MKKTISILGIFILVITVSISMLTKSPIEKYDFTDCQIGVLDYEGKEVLEFLNSTQAKEIVDSLMAMNIGGFGTKKYLYMQGGGQSGYRVYLKSGDTIKIETSHLPYIVINSRGYKCNYEDIKKLSTYQLEIMEKYYYSVNNQ